LPKRSPTFKPAHQRTDAQRKREADRRRYDVAWRKWYGTARWAAIREAQLAAYPLCVMCIADEVVEEATVCDHVTPHRGDEDLFWSGPFQSLCAHHHNSAKQREERANKNVNEINCVDGAGEKS
jgi:5-methylcytosine-specific restriction protein A